MRRWVMTATLALSLPALGEDSRAGAAVEVWPSKAQTLEDGRVEYVFDLRPLKAGKVAVDPGPDADEAAVKAFLASLPNETRVFAYPEKARISVDAPGGLEGAPFAASFSAVDAGPFAPASTFDRRPDPTGAPALHPDAPKVLPSADLLLWKNDVVQDGITAGVLLASDAGDRVVPLGRRALAEKLLTAALERYRNASGVAKEGARRLAVRIGGALGASTGRIPRALMANPELRELAAQASGEFTRPEPRFPPTPRTHWSPALTASAILERALGEPLGVDREGHAATLTLLAILESDPKLNAAWQAQRALRDAVFGKPEREVLEAYREAAHGQRARAALDDLSGFLSRLSLPEDSGGAAVLSRAESPVSRFVDQLHGPEQLHAIEELTLAVQDGRYALSGRHGWAAALLRPDAGVAERLYAEGGWRSRLVRTFQSLFGLHVEVPPGSADDFARAEAEGAHALKVRLKVPPHLEVEPVPGAYAEASASWAQLAEVLKSQRAAARIRGVRPDGSRRPLTAAGDAQQLERLYRGLSLLSRVSLGEDAARSDDARAAVNTARAFLARWRSDADLSQDVRYLLPASQTLEEGVILHSGAFGVSRRELVVRYEKAPRLEVQTRDPELAALFVADADASQRYLVPVLATGAIPVRRTAPLDLDTFRRLCDQAGRSREGIEAALPGVMVRSLQPISQDVP